MVRLKIVWSFDENPHWNDSNIGNKTWKKSDVSQASQVFEKAQEIKSLMLTKPFALLIKNMLSDIDTVIILGYQCWCILTILYCLVMSQAPIIISNKLIIFKLNRKIFSITNGLSA